MARKIEWLNFWCPIGVGIAFAGAALRWPEAGAELMAFGALIAVASIVHLWTRISIALIAGGSSCVLVYGGFWFFDHRHSNQAAGPAANNRSPQPAATRPFNSESEKLVYLSAELFLDRYRKTGYDYHIEIGNDNDFNVTIVNNKVFVVGGAEGFLNYPAKNIPPHSKIASSSFPFEGLHQLGSLTYDIQYSSREPPDEKRSFVLRCSFYLEMDPTLHVPISPSSSEVIKGEMRDSVYDEVINTLKTPKGDLALQLDHPKDGSPIYLDLRSGFKRLFVDESLLSVRFSSSYKDRNSISLHKYLEKTEGSYFVNLAWDDEKGLLRLSVNNSEGVLRQALRLRGSQFGTVPSPTPQEQPEKK